MLALWQFQTTVLHGTQQYYILFTPLNWKLISHPDKLAIEAYQNISGSAPEFFQYHKGTVIALNKSWSFTPVRSALQTRLTFTMESSHCALTAWLFWFCMLHMRDLNFCCFWLPVNNVAQAAHTAFLFMISFLFVKVCNAKVGVFLHGSPGKSCKWYIMLEIEL